MKTFKTGIPAQGVPLTPEQEGQLSAAQSEAEQRPAPPLFGGPSDSLGGSWPYSNPSLDERISRIIEQIIAEKRAEFRRGVAVGYRVTELILLQRALDSQEAGQINDEVALRTAISAIREARGRFLQQ